MSSPFLFYLRQFPSNILNGRGFGPHVVPRLSSTAQGIKVARQSTSSRINLGPQSKAFLPCHHRVWCLGSRTIKLRQTRCPATPCNVLAVLCSTTELYTGTKATEAASIYRWKIWLLYHNLRRKQINQSFRLRDVYGIFDDSIFGGLLGNRVVLRWVEAPTGKLDRLSKITSIPDVKQGLRLLIEVMKPVVNGPWPIAIIQDLLEAVLYQMTQIYCLYFFSFQGSNNPATSRRILREVEQEANRNLKGLPREWNIKRSG